MLIKDLSFIILCLCLLANVGPDAFVSGRRRARVWDERRPRLGRETIASGTAFADKLGCRICDLCFLGGQVGCSKSRKIKIGREATAPLKGRAFKIEISKVSGSTLVVEICTDPHNRLLRRQHCSSLCSQSELQCFAPGLRQMSAWCPLQRCHTRYAICSQNRTDIFLDFEHPLRGQSETIQGICSHRYNIRLVSFGYSLGNVFNRRIDNAKPIFLVLFWVIIDTMSQPHQHSVGVHPMEC